MAQFLPNTILHVEDQPIQRKGLLRRLSEGPGIRKLMGGDIKLVDTSVFYDLDNDDIDCSDPKYQISDTALDDEITRIEQEVLQNACIVGLSTAQVARGFLSKYLPAAIISDTSFPLNGDQIIEWMLKHGLRDYAFIGLSGKRPSNLSPMAQDFFMTTNSRYFWKLDVELPFEPEEYAANSLMKQIRRNIRDNRQQYGAPLHK